MLKVIVLSASAFACLSGCASVPPKRVVATADISAQEVDALIDALADRMVQLEVAYNPTAAYFIGVEVAEHSRWPDRSIKAVAAKQKLDDALLRELRSIELADASQAKRFIRDSMIERLESESQRRVCRSELWDINHMSGWHLNLAQVAREQPVRTAKQRAQAIERWSSLGALVDTEVYNARIGLRAGYSAPKSVVRRVIRQIEAIASAEAERTPFHSVSARSDDAEFRQAFNAVLAGPVRTAFRRYADFLKQEYLPRARDAIAITEHPNGRQCYRASLRSYTTLQRPPEEIFQLGRQIVADNVAKVRELGLRSFGTDKIPSIVRRIKEAPNNRFTSELELVQFSREVVEQARQKSSSLFLRMPAQEMRVEPLETYRRGTGGSSYYERQIDHSRPALYRIASEGWATITRGDAEITAVHEGYPGHHMQISFATAAAGGPIANLLRNSAYVEGWARYSEALSEEAGIYRTVYAPMSRRLWPARGMVVDPGVHLMGWTPEQAAAFIRESGRFGGTEADDLVDRIAVWPGQLTAYDSGAIEILALRREAEARLGDDFDLREFHASLLETGEVPLPTLREHIARWIASESRRRPQ